MILAVSVILFFASFLLVAGLAASREDAQAVALARRLDQAGGRAVATITMPGATRDARLSVIPWLDRALRSEDYGRRLELLLYQAGLSVRPGVLILASATAAAAGLLVGLLVLHNPIAALILCPALAAVPWAIVFQRRHARFKAFTAEFPDALNLLVSALRGGLSFSAALQIVAEESPEPVRSEFAITVEEQALGLDFREALEHLCRRVDTLDVRFFVTAVMLQRETGGNLAEVLGNTAALIRERFRVLGDIETMTAQGKLTGAILVALPLVMGFGMYLLAPDYFHPMLENPAGRVALWGAAGMQVLGIYVAYRIVNIKV